MVLKIKYIIGSLLICLSVQLTASNEVSHLKKEQVDTCYPKFKTEYKSLFRAIHRINMSYVDNYLHVLFVYNYDLDTNKNTKQWNILSSVLSASETAIENAREKNITYCPDIAEIYTMNAVALLYQKQYQKAYQRFDTAIGYYGHNTNRIDALLWLAHTSIYMDRYDTARSILQSIETTLDTTNIKTLIHYETVAADLSLKTFDYENALNHLLKVEQMSLSRQIHTRIKFIIAQIYTQAGKYEEAIPYYNEVKKPLFGVNNLMKSYAIVYKHFCEKLIIEEEQTNLAMKAAKEKMMIEPEEFEPTIIESNHDSSYIYMDYPYYFNDAAAMFFLDESTSDVEETGVFEDEDSTNYIDDYYEMHLTNEMLETIFDNWDSISIHIPKTDFSSMSDTIYLPLIEAGTTYTLPHFNPVFSRFGWRRYRYHYGIDTKNSIGDSIFCVFDGIVRIAKRNRTYGNIIIVRHYNGLETFYAHCSKLLVEQNQEIKAGELIALVGSTGRSTGPHLHFETRYKGTAFNPEYMIDFENGKLISDTLMITKETFNYRRSGNSSDTSPSPANAVYYKIRSGDTLSGIAKKYRTTVSNIKRLNGLKSDFIRDGRRIRVL
jgi:murein DD-endopeptidase MepM/ murein hydrolase activator NlpD